VRETVVSAGPRRALFTLRLVGATVLRRPSAFRDAISFAIVHKALWEYMDALGRHLEKALVEIERLGSAPRPVLAGAGPAFFHLEESRPVSEEDCA